MLVNNGSVGYAVKMKSFFFLLVCLFISVSIGAETVYKKVNPDGSVVFTDVESTDSEEVKIRKPTSFSPPKLPRLNLPTKKLKPKYNYSVVINQPANDSTIVGKHDVVVSVSVRPDIKRSGHQIRYRLAGQSITKRDSSVTFKNVDRGTHKLIVTIVDARGEAVSLAVSSTFHMKRFFKKSAPPKPKPKTP